MRRSRAHRSSGVGKIRSRTFDARGVVELHDPVAVGDVGETQAESLGIVLGLLKPFRGMLVAGFRLDDGDWEVQTVPEKIVRPLLLASARLAADEHDPAVGEGPLLVDGVRTVVPTRCLQPGNDVIPAGIGLVHPDFIRPSSWYGPLWRISRRQGNFI